jgi:preprotein translocase subunit YajC
MKFVIQRTPYDYLKLSCSLMFRKTGVKILAVLLIYNLIQLIFQSLGLITVFENVFLSYLIFMGVSVLFFLFFYWKMKRKYFSDNKAFGRKTYEIKEGEMIVTGDGLQVKRDLSKSLKIEETKNWFLIVESIDQLDFIPKKSLSQQEIIQLHNTFSMQKGVQFTA